MSLFPFSLSTQARQALWSSAGTVSTSWYWLRASTYITKWNLRLGSASVTVGLLELQAEGGVVAHAVYKVVQRLLHLLTQELVLAARPVQSAALALLLLLASPQLLLQYLFLLHEQAVLRVALLQLLLLLALDGLVYGLGRLELPVVIPQRLNCDI
eukprot:CAMPEP_0173216454 /NCGR_PEP_ID=MMETSP1141-20130122/27021_1 /TAXON_ID=483371 /ORGANISM="non described non described, Strain CCMP2298" /LENGTH=155 /DNA_ID=CAMNT_0014143899 /DNA_START=108 /DNA_END=575 /DNA_ORIENTATION=+